MHAIGWVADAVNNQLGLPGRMLCPSSPSTLSKAFAELTPAQFKPEYVDYLLKQDYNTNYCQSWFMVHTGPNLRSGILDDEKVWATIGGQPIRMNQGPLRTGTMSRAGPGRIPLLADARADASDNGEFLTLPDGRRLLTAKSVTDGPRFFYDQNNQRYPVQYRRATPFGSQDYENFGAAHGRGGLLNLTQNTFTIGNVLFGDGHVESFRDRYKSDANFKTGPPDGYLDSWDLEGSLFDVILSLGRRSASVTREE